MGSSLAGLTDDWECVCQRCKHRDKDDGLLPVSHEIDSVVADGKHINGKLALATAGGRAARPFWKEQHTWDALAAEAAIAEIGSARVKMGLPLTPRSSVTPPPSARKSPLAPVHWRPLPRMKGTSSAVKAVNTNDSDSLYAPGAMHADTKVLTPKVQAFVLTTAKK